MTDVVQLLLDLEGDRRLHHARLLVLLNVFSGRSGETTVEGLTKLAKLDFLLRYPTFLERAVSARGGDGAKVCVREAERHSVESSMVRYRYGPWDHRYRELLNELVGLGLVRVEVHGRTVHIGLTLEGRGAAQKLSSASANADLVRRSRLLKNHLNLSATRLMRFVYDTFPEIADLRMRQEITP